MTATRQTRSTPTMRSAVGKQPTTTLDRWLAWLGTPDCPCPSAWESLGRLHGMSMGHSWVRVGPDPACPHHGDARPADAVETI